MINFLKNLTLCTTLVFAFNGCGGGGSSISVLPSLDEFQQHEITDVKIDIFFMIDDSGSMAPAQEAMSDNLSNFISLFNNKGFDYRVAVGKTSAYGQANPDFFTAPHGRKILGSVEAAAEGYDLEDYFRETVEAVGVSGSGTERPLMSADDILAERAASENFPRPGAHLAVIYIGDENDSADSTPVQTYYDSLAAVVLAQQSGGSSGTFSTHAIQVTGTSTCKASTGYYGGSSSYGTIHSAASAGTRQFAMAALSGGMELSICSSFATSLSDLGDHIASLASAFPLTDVLDANGIATLKVYVEGLNGNNPIPQSSSNGYTFDQPNNSIVFHGSMIPPQGAIIGVTYTCGTLDCQ